MQTELPTNHRSPRLFCGERMIIVKIFKRGRAPLVRTATP
jgi:hypothetical protein